MKSRSMIRSQECKPYFKIFSGEYFKFPKLINKNFLGKKRNFVIAPKFTDFDIDTKSDLNHLEIITKTSKKKYKKYIHSKLQ